MKCLASSILIFLTIGDLCSAELASEAVPSPAQIQQELILALPDEAAAKALRERMATATPAAVGLLLMDLGLSGRVAARSLIVEQLNRTDPVIIERALRALAQLRVRGTDQRARVTALLGSTDVQVRVQAINCLATIDDLRVCPLLIERLTDPAPTVADAALAALRRLSGRNELAGDPVPWSDWHRTQQEASDQQFEALAMGLKSSEPKDVTGAIQSLTLMRGESARAIDLIEPLVRDEDLKIVFAARQALARLAPGDFQAPSAQEKVAALVPVAVPAPLAVGGLQRLLPGNGIFDTWMGLVIAAVGASGALGATVFLLRTPVVRSATKRFVRGVASGTARIMKPAGRIITTSTGRVFRPITKRIRKATERIHKATVRMTKGADGAKVSAGKSSAKS